MALLEQPRSLLREGVCLLERRATRYRSDDVDAIRSARLHVAGEPDVVEQLPDQLRDLDRKLEAAVGRIEIEEDEVGTVRLVDARVPRVHVDAVVLHHEEHRLGRVHERKVDEPRATLARPRPELPRRDPVRQVLRRLLLEEHLARDPVRIALHRERPVAQVRNERVCNLLVVREHVALRDPVVRKEDAVGRAQLDSLRFSHSAFLTANTSQSLLK